MLVVVAALAILNTARSVVGYLPVAGDGGPAAPFSITEFLLTTPEQTLAPALVGLFSAVAAGGVFRARHWSIVLVIGVGVAMLMGGVLLALPSIVEWGVLGSFALLLLPAGLLAVLIGMYLVYAALANRAYLSR